MLYIIVKFIYIISVSGIPMLIVLKSDGNMVTKNGRETIRSHGSNTVKEWIKSTHIFDMVSSGEGGYLLNNEELKNAELEVSTDEANSSKGQSLFCIPRA